MLERSVAALVLPGARSRRHCFLLGGHHAAFWEIYIAQASVEIRWADWCSLVKSATLPGAADNIFIFVAVKDKNVLDVRSGKRGYLVRSNCEVQTRHYANSIN